MKKLMFISFLTLIIFFCNCTNTQQKEIESFRKKIIEQEDQLFGISLYYQGIIYLYSTNDKLIKQNKIAYKNIMERGDSAIKEANRILREVQKNPQNLNLIRDFEFPPIHGDLVLEETTKRVRILIETYKELFPSRPRNIPLSKEENIKLMEAASNKL